MPTEAAQPEAPAATAPSWKGELLHIHVAPVASSEMAELDAAMLVAGRGIEGDRYFLGTGTYSKLPGMREVTLFEMEVLDALARNDPPLQQAPIRLDASEHRRNLTVRGVPVGHLVGVRFRIGEVVLRGARLNFPCKYLERLLKRPVYQALYNRSGLNCEVETGGIVRRGAAVEPL
ncbi:MAG: MOSC domain-containing protein [Xanthobacteraceae bacterium]